MTTLAQAVHHLSFLTDHSDNDNVSDSDTTEILVPTHLVPSCHTVTGPSTGAGVAGAHGAQGHCTRRHAVGGEPHPYALCGKNVLKHTRP